MAFKLEPYLGPTTCSRCHLEPAESAATPNPSQVPKYSPTGTVSYVYLTVVLETSYSPRFFGCATALASYPVGILQAELVHILEWREEIEFQYDLLSLE